LTSSGLPQSVKDLDAIYSYIKSSSPAQADLVRNRIVAAVQRIQQFPQSGRIVPEAADLELREIIVRPHRIVYRLRAGTAEIVTIFRGTREIPADVLL